MVDFRYGSTPEQFEFEATTHERVARSHRARAEYLSLRGDQLRAAQAREQAERELRRAQAQRARADMLRRR